MGKPGVYAVLNMGIYGEGGVQGFKAGHSLWRVAAEMVGEVTRRYMGSGIRLVGIVRT